VAVLRHRSRLPRPRRNQRQVEEGCVNASLALGVVLTLFSSEQRPRPQITLAVCDRAGIAIGTWRTAKQQAIRILDSAGIDVLWIETSAKNGCAVDSSDAYFVVIVSRNAPKDLVRFDTMGFALRTGAHPRAYVFYDLVRSFVRNFNPSDPKESSGGVILGHAIAHELGHTLIPGDAHGAGIMRANWAYTEWREALGGVLLFHPDDVKAMQEQIRSR
jgi:hypothetical protein